MGSPASGDVASSVISALSSLETGHPALAVSASFANVACSVPGTFGLERQAHGSDGVAAFDLLEGHLRGSVDLFGRQSGFAEDQ